MTFSSPTKKRIIITLASITLGAFILQAGGWLLMREGGLTMFFNRVLTPEILRNATSTPELPPLFPDRTRPFAVMIDNHPDALPQSGIAEADYIWEVPVEGGLTRLMAVFKSVPAAEIGPVRSARTYFLSWAREFDAVYAHVGGSDEALNLLANGKADLADANEFRSGNAFWRDNARKAPHNVYTSTEKMRDLMSRRAWPETSDWMDASVRSDVAPSGPKAEFITVKHVAGAVQATYGYDATTQTYVRRSGGTKTVDKTGQAVEPKTVIVVETDYMKVPDPQGKGLIGLRTTGEGKATVFRDGVAVEGTWKKASAKDQTQIYDMNGKKTTFRQGQVWMNVVATNRGGAVTFK